MFVRHILAALLSLACAHAIAFDFVLKGTINYGGGTFFSPWLGSLHVETDSFADGIYSGSDLRSFEFASNVFTYPGRLTYDIPPTVRLLDGQAAEITVSGSDGFWFFHIDGFTTSYHFSISHGPTPVDAEGTLVAIPEPATFALFLAGLTLIGAVRVTGSGSRSGTESA